MYITNDTIFIHHEDKSRGIPYMCWKLEGLEMCVFVQLSMCVRARKTDTGCFLISVLNCIAYALMESILDQLLLFLSVLHK